MDILFAVIASLVVGAILAAVLGQPLLVLTALIVGALFANRRGYRHQAQAMRREFNSQPISPPSTRPATGDRLAEVERLRASGVITDAEAADRRKAILDTI